MMVLDSALSRRVLELSSWDARGLVGCCSGHERGGERPPPWTRGHDAGMAMA